MRFALQARKILSPLILFAGFSMPARTVEAGEPKWPSGLYSYRVVDEDLRSVLQHFGDNNGIRIALSDKVQGRVHGQLQSASPRDFLNNLTKEFGLDWYYDDSTLWISATSETMTKLLALRGISLGALAKSLSAAGLLDPRFPLRSGLGPNTALISGPPRYLSMTDDVLDALVAGLSRPVGLRLQPKRTVTIFRGAAVSHVEFP